jgi:hypothetical protein
MSIGEIANALFRRLGYQIERVAVEDPFPLIRPIDRNGVQILGDSEFQNSCRCIGDYTLLDTPRLANLWMLCRMTDPSGAMIEIGSYKGGGALHLSNCCPDRGIVVCDPFSKEGFESIHPTLDRTFSHGQFADSSLHAVRHLLRDRKAIIIPGYFPASVRRNSLPKLSFVHLDIDIYKATKESLLFLLTEADLCRRSLLVLDDYKRGAAGVDIAVEEVLQEIKGTLAFPLFPGQALLLPRSWYA